MNLCLEGRHSCRPKPRSAATGMSPLRCSRGLPLGGLLTALFCLFAFTHSARTADITTPTPLLNDPVAGLALAADVRDARPAANTELHGLLKIRRRDGSTTNVPIVSRIVLADKSWQAIYQGGPTNQGETLIVTRAAGAPTEYRYAQQGAAPADAVGHRSPKKLPESVGKGPGTLDDAHLALGQSPDFLQRRHGHRQVLQTKIDTDVGQHNGGQQSIGPGRRR